jgi:hypothetical protein
VDWQWQGNSTWRKIYPSITLSTTAPICNDLCSKPILHGEGQQTSHVYHNTTTNKDGLHASLLSIFVFTKSNFLEVLWTGWTQALLSQRSLIHFWSKFRRWSPLLRIPTPHLKKGIKSPPSPKYLRISHLLHAYSAITSYISQRNLVNVQTTYIEII